LIVPVALEIPDYQHSDHGYERHYHVHAMAGL
jgi:hypothetical protein